ncbi:PREDICTED: tRNA pseudouridine synthase-like 1 isoform X2 [Polistes canadensis]|uniref:tRNA pseudouridine synthase-like 1 isoform X2 n=1 Tax=Polistes canadensis TaxID=91411 RepID=UPI000718C38B|nr:PREDICTED: tRNA pseudouridine synthase-like 1 isoform X2 [Polistes canadensis]
MGKYFIKFSFIGTLYRGLQKHVNKNILDIDSVQGAIETALLTIHPKPVSKPRLYLTSRTDAGVHALQTIGQITLENRILECVPVVEEFQAKNIVKSKTYIYRFMIAKKYDEQRLPISEMCHSFHLKSYTFDIERMKEGTKLFMGLKDFRTFASQSNKCLNRNYVRSLNSLTIEKAQPLMYFDELSTNFNYWHVVISSKGFLFNQVRRITSALLGLGTGRITEKDINTMLQVPSTKNWNTHLPVVVPHGLHLVKVDYDLNELEKYTIKDKLKELNIDSSIQSVN